MTLMHRHRKEREAFGGHGIEASPFRSELRKSIRQIYAHSTDYHLNSRPNRPCRDCIGLYLVLTASHCIYRTTPWHSGYEQTSPSFREH